MTKIMKVTIQKIRDKAVVPECKTEHAAGMDVAAAIDKPLKLAPGKREIIPTGIAIALPVGYEAQVRGRSGLAAKYGVTLANGVGTIDADFRGEIGVILINLGHETFTIEPGMRIAQLVVAKYEQVSWDVVAKLEETKRGGGGYGHTGHHG